jgi:hypothetical protein
MDLPRLLEVSTRRQRIASAAAQAVRDHWVTLHDGAVTIPAAPLAQELLVYRVDNGRLLADLEEQLGGEPGALARLHASEDSMETQTLLHGLLVTKAGDSRGPILQELQRLAVQTEPLLVDNDGVVINGNRRLAAMRRLLAEDPQRYQRFHTPLVAILPPGVSRADLEFLEASLQMAPDTKLAYGWLERRLKLREQHARLGLADEWIQEAYRLADPAQLEQELAELALAETFLEQFQRQPRRYSSLEDAEPLIVGLSAQLPLLPKRLRPCWQALGFLLIDRRAELDGGMAKHFPFTAPPVPLFPAETLSRLAQEWGMEREPSGDEQNSSPLLAVAPPQAQLRALATATADGQGRSTRAKELQDVLDTLRMQCRQGQPPQRLLINLRNSRKLLARVTPDQLSAEERSRLQGELAAIAAQGVQLLGPAGADSIEAQPPLRGSRRKRSLWKRLLGRVRGGRR